MKIKVVVWFHGKLFGDKDDIDIYKQLYLDIKEKREGNSYIENRVLFDKLLDKITTHPEPPFFFYDNLEGSITMEYSMAERLQLWDIAHGACFKPQNALGRIILNAIDLSEYAFMLTGKEWIKPNELRLNFGCTDFESGLEFINAAQGGKLKPY